METRVITPPKQLVSYARRIMRRAERIVFATGHTVQCPFCQWEGWRFLSAGDSWKSNRLCPGCGSLERYRMLALVLERRLAGRERAALLEIAPKLCVKQLCKQRGWEYLSSDLNSQYAMVHADLRAMPMQDNSFDVIVCFHVMEHIVDDRPALGEIARLLKADGFGLIFVPLGDGPTREGAPESEWLRLYGQRDHVRIYGMDIVDRMTGAGLAVDVVDTHEYFTDADLTRHGLRGDDRLLFVVRKAAVE
jgi:SAM-dependent methyltransferase